MRRDPPLRAALPITQTILAALFGGIGLWQRAQILNKPLWGGQTLWNSTAAFHVWPWPYKFAAIANLPAMIAGALISFPMYELWPRSPEWLQAAPCLICVAPLWYWVGRRLDQNMASANLGRTRTYVLVLIFVGLGFIGAIIPLGYVGYVPYGAILWMAFAIAIWARSGLQTAQPLKSS